jgi:HK97 family phage portal protein
MWQRASWVELCMVHSLMHGNMYLRHVYNNAGAITGLLPIHPLAVAPRWDMRLDPVPGARLYDVSYFNGRAEQNLTALDLTHVMGLSFDGLKGISPLSAARISLGGSLAGDKAAAKQFTNGPLIAGLLVPDDDMEIDEAKEAKKQVVNAMNGPENAGDVVLLNRKLTFSPWQMTAADAQFLESREFQIEEIGRWFGIPPHLLGVTEKATSWGQGITEQNRGFARYTLRKHTTPFQQALSDLIPSGKTAEFDYGEFVAASPEDQSTMLLAEVNGGVITPNEMRAIKNMAPIAGGESLRTPPGAAPAALPGAPLAEPAPAGPPAIGGAA